MPVFVNCLLFTCFYKKDEVLWLVGLPTSFVQAIQRSQLREYFAAIQTKPHRKFLVEFLEHLIDPDLGQSLGSKSGGAFEQKNDQNRRKPLDFSSPNFRKLCLVSLLNLPRNLRSNMQSQPLGHKDSSVQNRSHFKHCPRFKNSTTNWIVSGYIYM